MTWLALPGYPFLIVASKSEKGFLGWKSLLFITKLCFSDAAWYYCIFNKTNHKITLFETLSTITRTLFVFGLGASAVYNDGSNKIYGVVFICNKKRNITFGLWYIVSVMFQRYWLLLWWQEGQKRSLIQAITIYIYIYIYIWKNNGSMKRFLNLTLNQLY